MKTIKLAKIRILCTVSLTVAALLVASGLLAAPASAQCTSENSANCGGPSGNTTPTTPSGCQTSATPNGKTATSAELQQCLKNNKITSDLNTIVNFLSAAVGIVVVGVIIMGGIQYTLAGGNPTALAAARGRITNALIALVLFMFIYAFLQWIIPGGAFG